MRMLLAAKLEASVAPASTAERPVEAAGSAHHQRENYLLYLCTPGSRHEQK